MEISWIGTGAGGKAAFMSVNEVSVRADMVATCADVAQLQKSLENCQEKSIGEILLINVL